MPVDLPPPQAEIVIVAPRLPDSERERVYSHAELNAGDLQAAGRVDDALRQTPAASLFRRTNSAIANASTQGLSFRAVAPSGAGRALVTLDGVPLNDPFGNWVIWSQLGPDTIERVDIVRGAGAGAYGAGALTGTAQLYETTNADSSWAATAGIGEDGAERLSARAYPALGSGRLALSIAGERQDGFTPVRSAQRGPVDIDAFYKSSSGAARWAGELGGADLALRLGAYEEQRGGGVVGVKSASRGAMFSAALAQTDADGEGWRASIWAHRSDFENTSASVNPTRSMSTPANEQYATPALGYGGNAAWRTRIGAAEFELGGDARFYNGETREHYSFNAAADAFRNNRVSGGEENIAGLYTEASYHTGSWLFTGGLRLDHWSTQDAQRLETVIASGATLNDIHAPERDGELASWRFGLARALSEDVSVRAAAYSGFRPPSLNELHRPFRVGSDVTEANPSLDPERLYGAEFGLNGQSDQWDWSATLFYNRLEDAIANVTIATSGSAVLQGYDGALIASAPPGGVLRQRSNLDAVNAVGLEAGLAYRFTRDLSLRAGVSATDARVDGGSLAPDLTGNRPAQAPIYSLTAGADWSVTEAWRLRADWRWESGRWEDDQNTRRLAEGGQLNLQSSWRLNARTELRLHADNLLDSEIETAETADGVESLSAPRQIWIELALR